jgi:hypothetical protein
LIGGKDDKFKSNWVLKNVTKDGSVLDISLERPFAGDNTTTVTL